MNIEEMSNEMIEQYLSENYNDFITYLLVFKEKADRHINKENGNENNRVVKMEIIFKEEESEVS